MNERTNSTSSDDEEPAQPLKIRQIAASTVAAAFGVQSRKNRERDFSRGDIRQFIIAGILFTAFFVGAVVGVVSLVLRNT